MRYLLDTNACIAVMRNHPDVMRAMAAVSPGDCVVSTVTSYELYTGVEKCADPAKERSKVSLLLGTVSLLAFDNSAAQSAARVRAALERTGRVIGPYDLLLAGQALSLGLVLVTHNVSEFSRVSGLAIEDWQSAAP